MHKTSRLVVVPLLLLGLVAGGLLAIQGPLAAKHLPGIAQPYRECSQDVATLSLRFFPHCAAALKKYFGVMRTAQATADLTAHWFRALYQIDNLAVVAYSAFFFLVTCVCYRSLRATSSRAIWFVCASTSAASVLIGAGADFTENFRALAQLTLDAHLAEEELLEAAAISVWKLRLFLFNLAATTIWVLLVVYMSLRRTPTHQ